MYTDPKAAQGQGCNGKSIIYFRCGDVIYTEGGGIRDRYILRISQLARIKFAKTGATGKMLQQKPVDMVVMCGRDRAAFFKKPGNTQLGCITRGLERFPFDRILVRPIKQAGYLRLEFFREAEFAQ